MFILKRFIREIIVATIIAVLLRSALPLYSATLSPAVFFLVVLAWSRIVTESYKLFIRSESQERYLVPSQVHVWRRVPFSTPFRLLLGVLAGFVLWSMYKTVSVLATYLSTPIVTMSIGLVAGLATALGGGYKDGLFEGFSPRKFIRSPLIGTFGGLLLSLKGVSHTHTAMLFFGSIGAERMIVECYKGFLKSGYSPGKFKHQSPRTQSISPDVVFFSFPTSQHGWCSSY